jgi:hypothetical protein
MLKSEWDKVTNGTNSQAHNQLKTIFFKFIFYFSSVKETTLENHWGLVSGSSDWVPA